MIKFILGAVVGGIRNSILYGSCISKQESGMCGV